MKLLFLFMCLHKVYFLPWVMLKEFGRSLFSSDPIFCWMEEESSYPGSRLTWYQSCYKVHFRDMVLSPNSSANHMVLNLSYSFYLVLVSTPKKWVLAFVFQKTVQRILKIIRKRFQNSQRHRKIISHPTLSISVCFICRAFAGIGI